MILDDIMDTLADGPDFLDHFDAELFAALVGKIIVDSNTQLRFRLINGLELTEAIDCADKERSNAKIAEILAEQTVLKQQKEEVLKNTADADRICNRMTQAEQVLNAAEPYLTEWNETTIRQLVERATVLSKDEILVRLKGGREIRQSLH